MASHGTPVHVSVWNGPPYKSETGRIQAESSFSAGGYLAEINGNKAAGPDVLTLKTAKGKE
jgi:hypothetical protein